MIESLYPVKQRHMNQVLTHSRTLPEAPASNLGHPCTYRFLCSCWEELPTPRPRGAQKLSLWRGKKKNPPQEPFFTSAELSQTWAWLNYHVPSLAFDLLLLEYLSHCFPICIRAEPIFSLHLTWFFFSHWWLRRCELWPTISKIPALQNSTTQIPAHREYSITHTYIRFLSQKEDTELKSRVYLHW